MVAPQHLLVLWALLAIVRVRALEPPTEKRDAALPPCGACTNLVASFESGLTRTARGKLGGGDTAWEEKAGQKYSTSEVRLVEITEELCRGVSRGETQCHQLAGEWEEKIEEWWRLEGDRPSLREWLCVDQQQVCCPAEHFGPQCEKCGVLGLGDRLCSGNGKCKGVGTRKGNGKCSCTREYSGERCDQCSAGHYESFRDDNKLLCSSCHKACASHCTGPGPKSCAKCKEGYEMDSEHGCMDIDECQHEAGKSCIKENKFCVNTEGTFRCMKCDKGCKGCDGDGPDNCLECAEGHQKNKDNVCISDKQAELEASEAAEEDMEEEAVGTSPEDVVDTLDEATAKEEL